MTPRSDSDASEEAEGRKRRDRTDNQNRADSSEVKQQCRRRRRRPEAPRENRHARESHGQLGARGGQAADSLAEDIEGRDHAQHDQYQEPQPESQKRIPEPRTPKQISAQSQALRCCWARRSRILCSRPNAVSMARYCACVSGTLGCRRRGVDSPSRICSRATHPDSAEGGPRDSLGSEPRRAQVGKPERRQARCPR